MSMTAKDMIAAAKAAVAPISFAEAQEKLAAGALLLDVRDGPEVEKTGMARGAHHISRGMLEFRADEGGPFHDPELRRDRPVILYCASGGRAFLAGKTLHDMGYRDVRVIGGLSDWTDPGGELVHPLDPGM